MIGFPFTMCARYHLPAGITLLFFCWRRIYVLKILMEIYDTLNFQRF
jgi:hypothetical protein